MKYELHAMFILRRSSSFVRRNFTLRKAEFNNPAFIFPVFIYPSSLVLFLMYDNWKSRRHPKIVKIENSDPKKDDSKIQEKEYIQNISIEYPEDIPYFRGSEIEKEYLQKRFPDKEIIEVRQPPHGDDKYIDEPYYFWERIAYTVSGSQVWKCLDGVEERNHSVFGRYAIGYFVSCSVIEERQNNGYTIKEHIPIQVWAPNGVMLSGLNDKEVPGACENVGDKNLSSRKYTLPLGSVFRVIPAKEQNQFGPWRILTNENVKITSVSLDGRWEYRRYG